MRLVLACLALLLAAPVANAQTAIAIRSGMAWPSGAAGGNGGMDDLEAFRGRSLDVRVLFLPMNTWANMVSSTKHVRAHAATGARISIGVPMLPEEARGQHMACWQQKFATHIRNIGLGLINAGAANAIIRLGWEANRPNGYPWAIVAGKESHYIGCWRKWVGVLRSLPGQAFVFDWTMQEKSGWPASAIYPGSEWVGIIGIDIYDRCPPVRTEAEWTARLNQTHSRTDTANPRGPATWLAFAKARGKKLSIPEWGIGGPKTVQACTEPGIDNPFWIRKWHGWLSTNTAAIAYESYFNAHGFGDNGKPPTNGTHRLAPTTWNPQSAAVYKELWGRP